MAAAGLLARAGVHSRIIERHRQPYPLPRAVHVDDEARRILQHLGLARQFAQVSRPLPGMRLLDARHQVFGEILRGTDPGYHGHVPDSMFDQPVLEDQMFAALSTQPEVSWHTGAEVTGVEISSDGSPVVIVDDGVQHRIEADYVLGCDGANSLVRRVVGAQLRDFHFEERWLVVDVQASEDLDTWDGLEQVCDPARAATFMKVVGRRYRFEFQMHDGETVDSLAAVLDDLIGPWTKGVDYTLVRLAEYTFRARVTDRWRSGRVFLLGDAAHTTPPFIGQGLCAGLRDAANLSWKVAAHLHGHAGDEILQTYGTERGPNASHVVRMAVLLGNAMTGGQARTARVRRSVAGRLLSVPLLNRRFAANVVPPLRHGPLVGPGKRCGWHLPQPLVQVGTEVRPLDDVLGTGFVLVGSHYLPADALAAAALVGATVVRVHAWQMPRPVPTATVTDVVDPDGQLLDWLRPARSLLVRPDRVVFLIDPTPEDIPDFLRRRTADDLVA